MLRFAISALVFGAAAHLGMFKILMNNRGTTGDGGDGGDKGNKGNDKTFSQADVDGIVQERLARQGKKFADYEDLKTFKTEHEKNNEAATKKALEDTKNYEELKKGWNEKEGKYQTGLTEKDNQIKSLKIGNALSLEISKHNAHPEAATILQGIVSLSDDGTPQMKGKDQVGNDVSIPLADGVKKFLEERPYLVKANNQGGGGGDNNSSSGSGGGAGNQDTTTLTELNTQLATAQATGDYKAVQEIKGKINANFKSRGLSRTI